MTGARLAIHLWFYRRSALYRWAWNWHVTWGLHRLQGYGRFEAMVSILAHRVCGHRMFWYPRAKREEMRRG
jgi:hypothetical protein